MSLLTILILIAAALLIRLPWLRSLRRWALLVSSVLAIFWLQPALPIRQMDFWFPVATLGLVFLSWGLASRKEQSLTAQNGLAAGLTVGTVLLIALTRLVSLEGVVTPSRPPQFYLVLLVLGALVAISFLLVRLLQPGSIALKSGLVILLIFFVILKNPTLAQLLSAGLRQVMAQNTLLAAHTDLSWLGFSYVAFRLIHTLIDRLNGRLEDIQLDEYLIFIIFYPTFIAGPLDRLQRFRKDLNQPLPLNATTALQSGRRLALGLFRKFVLADTLALVALSASNANQINHTGWLWLLLFAFSFQLFFDFAGYTDIAIGLGLLLGFQLPENFNQPYRQPNLTQFWNNWHMTLTQWFRGYFFNPVTRLLRKGSQLPAPLIILITQISTMVVIGMWHGITLNFLIWGVWHGLGLFVHNRWANFAAPKTALLLEQKTWLKPFFRAGGVLLTFIFVSLGWLWFALPDTAQSLRLFSRLFGGA